MYFEISALTLVGAAGGTAKAGELARSRIANGKERRSLESATSVG
jgi:hypothetical protein